MQAVLFPRFGRGEKLSLHFLLIPVVHSVGYHRKGFQVVKVPNVVREGVYCPRDYTQKGAQRLPGVVEDVQAQGEGAGPELRGLLPREPPFGRPLLKLDVIYRGCT